MYVSSGTEQLFVHFHWGPWVSGYLTLAKVMSTTHLGTTEKHMPDKLLLH